MRLQMHMTPIDQVHQRIDQRARRRGRGGRHFFSEARKAAEKDFSAGVAELADASADVESCSADSTIGRSHAGSNPAASPSLAAHEVLESAKTPFAYLVHLAIAAKARGIGFQLDGSRFYCICTAIDWRFIEGEAVMG